MTIKAKCVFTEAERKQQKKLKIDVGDSAVPNVAMFLSELLSLKISSERKEQNLQLLLVAVQHWGPCSRAQQCLNWKLVNRQGRHELLTEEATVLEGKLVNQ